MIVVLTGAIGIGKTRVCIEFIKLAKNLGYYCGGVLTHKAGEKELIIEDILSGKREGFASVNNIYDGPRTPKYYFSPRGIEFGIQAIQSGTSASVLIVDELGRLELAGAGFADVLEIIKQGKVKHCILVIRKELLTGFLPRLPRELTVLEVTVENRNQLPQEMVQLFKERLEDRGLSN